MNGFYSQFADFSKGPLNVKGIFTGQARANTSNDPAEDSNYSRCKRFIRPLEGRTLPLFYEQLIMVFEHELRAKPNEDMLVAAAAHGRELLRLGYSLSHVVHAYGAMCQAITETAVLEHANISPEEFHILNGCLDIAIASAVSEYQYRSNEVSEMEEVKRLGFLAHELRNSLSSATVAHEMIKAGMVGTGGSTARVLEANLARIRDLIDRSLSEVRLRTDASIFIEKFRLSDLFDQITLTAEVEAIKKTQILSSEVDVTIEVESDRQFLLTVIANLVQNAIKYNKPGKKIWLRASVSPTTVHMEVEDECGGLDETAAKVLFLPFIQGNSNRQGLGLGLAIVKRAVDLLQGKVFVVNKPGSGCVFVVEIPKILSPDATKQTVVPGKDAIQPDLSKNGKFKVAT